MKKVLLLLSATLFCLAGCTDVKNAFKKIDNGIVSLVTASGTQTASYIRGGQIGASGKISVSVNLKAGNEFLNKSLKNVVKYGNSVLYSGNQILKENYTFEFYFTFTYYSGVDESQKQVFSIYDGDKSVGMYEYTASVALYVPTQVMSYN